jgi:hypothetical protein
LRRVDPISRIMRTAYQLSRADTCTPVSYWMSIPLRQLFRWLDVVAEVQAQDKKG